MLTFTWFRCVGAQFWSAPTMDMYVAIIAQLGKFTRGQAIYGQYMINSPQDDFQRLKS
ncbi:hypothetical protein Plhal304r1_c033g0105061 [Plasmopara halstedii]